MFRYWLEKHSTKKCHIFDNFRWWIRLSIEILKIFVFDKIFYQVNEMFYQNLKILPYQILNQNFWVDFFFCVHTYISVYHGSRRRQNAPIQTSSHAKKKTFIGQLPQQYFSCVLTSVVLKTDGGIGFLFSQTFFSMNFT